MNERLPHISSSFVPAGSNDWKLLIDLPDANYVFPPEVLATFQRPDIVIWSERLQKILLIELTCPSEENIAEA